MLLVREAILRAGLSSSTELPGTLAQFGNSSCRAPSQRLRAVARSAAPYRDPCLFIPTSGHPDVQPPIVSYRDTCHGMPAHRLATPMAVDISVKAGIGGKACTAAVKVHTNPISQQQWVKQEQPGHRILMRGLFGRRIPSASQSQVKGCLFLAGIL